MTLADLKQGQQGIITDVSSLNIPLKLLEMGCLPGSSVELVQVAPFAGPIYININGSHLSIRKEIATHILIEMING